MLDMVLNFRLLLSFWTKNFKAFLAHGPIPSNEREINVWTTMGTTGRVRVCVYVSIVGRPWTAQEKSKQERQEMLASTGF